MHPLLAAKQNELAELCRRFGVRRLEVFGSAARSADFDPLTSDVDFLVELDTDRHDLTTFLDFKDALEVIGEAAGKVSPAARSTMAAIRWRGVIGMRHRLIHGYADVSLDVVWATVRDDLPTPIVVLEGVIPGADDPERST